MKPLMSTNKSAASQDHAAGSALPGVVTWSASRQCASAGEKGRTFSMRFCLRDAPPSELARLIWTGAASSDTRAGGRAEEKDKRVRFRCFVVASHQRRNSQAATSATDDESNRRACRLVDRIRWRLSRSEFGDGRTRLCASDGTLGRNKCFPTPSSRWRPTGIFTQRSRFSVFRVTLPLLARVIKKVSCISSAVGGAFFDV